MPPKQKKSVRFKPSPRLPSQRSMKSPRREKFGVNKALYRAVNRGPNRSNSAIPDMTPKTKRGPKEHGKSSASSTESATKVLPTLEVTSEEVFKGSESIGTGSIDTDWGSTGSGSVREPNCTFESGLRTENCRGNMEFLKPPKTTDSLVFSGSRSISTDSLVSSAYGIVAMKRKENDKKRVCPSENSSSRAAQQYLSTSTYSNESRDDRRRIRRKNSRVPVIGNNKKTAQIVTKKIENFILEAPHIYDSQFATSHAYRRETKAPKSMSDLWPGTVKAPMAKESFVDGLKFDGGGSESVLPLPTIASSQRPSVSAQPHSSNRPYTSAAALTRTKSNKIVSLKSLLSSSGSIQASSNKDLNEDLLAVPWDLKVKITTSAVDEADGAETRRTDSVKKISGLNANIVPVSWGRGEGGLEERTRWLDDLAFKKLLARSEETSYDVRLNVNVAAREPFSEDCRTAFRNARIPALRKSPALIVWPRPPPRIAPPSNASSMISNLTGEDRLSFSSATAARSTAGKGVSFVSTKSDVAAAKSLSSATLPSVNESEVTGDVTAQSPVALPLHPWWGNTIYGPLRVDQYSIGHPRFHPWAPFNPRLVSKVRCWIRCPANCRYLPHRNPKALGPLIPKGIPHLEEELSKSDSDEEDSRKKIMLTRSAKPSFRKKNVKRGHGVFHR